MITVLGTFENGLVKLDKDFSSKNPVKVLITFLDEVQSISKEGFKLSDFSFSQSQKNLSALKSSLSDAVIEERQSEK